MDQEFWSCICKNTNQLSSTYDMIECLSCQGKAHASCHELYSSEAKQHFLCLRCRVSYNDPFCEIETCLIEPLSFMVGSKILQEVSIYITPKQYDLITKEKTHTMFAVVTKVIYQDLKYVDFPEEKNVVVVHLNDKPLTYHKRGKIVLDNCLLPRENKIKLASHQVAFKCVFAVYFALKVDVKIIAKKILALEGQLSPEEAKRNFESIRFNELEVLAFFPVKDPITNEIIKFPARGSSCKHLQCFDLINFLKFYQRTTDKLWQCFWCKNIIPWRELRIDQYIYGVLKEVEKAYHKKEDEITNICFDEEGNWKPQDEFSKDWERSHERKEKREVNKSDKIEEEKHTKSEQPQKKIINKELPIEECIESYNLLQKQMINRVDVNKFGETIASKMKELNCFKNYTPRQI